ncbi:hypothetical protein [Psychroserpens algicola]|nr:hypothetical protein [Psychroserpens algicola]
MKNIIKLFSVICLVMCFSACDDNDDLKFRPTENIGWIQFPGSNPASLNYNLSFDVGARVGIDVQVPRVENDLTIGYNLVSVSGLDPNSAFSNSGSIVSPAGESSYAGPDNSTGLEYTYLADIEFDFTELPVLTEPMVFDIVLASTNDAGIQVGFNDEKPTVQRMTICPAVESTTGFALGDYTLTVPTGDGPFGPQFADGTVVTLTEGSGGEFTRVFQADYLPGIGAGLPVVDVDFTFAQGGTTISGPISTGVGCGAEILLDTGDAADLPCGDDVIMLNLLDFVGGAGDCGQADVEMTIMLTKI